MLLSPSEKYPESLQLPKLPANLKDLDTEEKKIALFEKSQVTCAKAYEIATYLNNRDAYTAKWKLVGPLGELFSRLGDIWDDDIIPLRTCLIQLFETRENLKFANPCPIHVTSADIICHDEQFFEYTE